LLSSTPATRPSSAAGLKTAGTQIPRRCAFDLLLLQWKAVLLRRNRLNVQLPDRKPGQLFDVA
jgi:hypothetical protein